MVKRVVLAGGGHAHLAVLADWARRPMPGVDRWLITSARHTAYSGMFPGWLAGIYQARDLFIDLQPLAEMAGARLELAEVTGLNAGQSTLELSNGTRLTYDQLSLATGGHPEISDLSALGERLYPAKPVATFIDRWTAFLDSAIIKPGVHVGVVGGGAAGVELALAVQTSLRRHFVHGRVSLIVAAGGLLSGHAEAVRRLALAELGQRGVRIHHSTAVGTEEGLRLADGTTLALDCVIAATGSRAPRWLASSGLACSSGGFIEVGPDLRSRSHANVFAAGDIVERTDRQVARSGVHAVKAGPVLASNLHAALTGGPTRHYLPRKRTLYLLATGEQRAILSWGNFAAVGAWEWKLKDCIDRHFVEGYKVHLPVAAIPQGKRRK